MFIISGLKNRFKIKYENYCFIYENYSIFVALIYRKRFKIIN